MKNIHVVQTEKPSRLFNYKGEFGLAKGFQNGTDVIVNQNIYITSDEEIKQGDWTLMFDDLGNLFLCDKPQQYLGIEKGHHLNKGLRKVTLTTDQNLIKEGVQAIDDEFLEWFVKNPICERVKVQSMFNMIQFTPREFIYKIIIPKEEPKQEAIEEFLKNNLEFIHNSVRNSDFDSGFKTGGIIGAIWQEEQDKKMYSEEDLLESFIDGYKFRAEASDLIFDNASRMYAIHIFNQKFKNK